MPSGLLEPFKNRSHFDEFAARRSNGREQYTVAGRLFGTKKAVECGTIAHSSYR